MKLIKTIRLIWTFYRSFLFASLTITGCSIILFKEYGMSIFVVLFWLKLTTLALTIYFINRYKSKEFYYYRNLGISKVLLWTATLTIDFFLFIFFILQTYKFK